AAVEALARSWAHETQNMKLRVNCVNPGATRTAMRAQAMPGEDPQTLPTPDTVARAIVALGDPALTVTGKLFDVPENRFMDYNRPA
ncbi:MAG: SDR family oxidoreductase, partial [Notoacmeibacter sp.]|nr:SDR family oxidoreductase [Notoacmeibacter sp.]